MLQSTHLPLRRPTSRTTLPVRSARLLIICNALKPDQPQVAVLGAGAAGLTAAYFAAKSGANVLVLEKNPESGRKILISGGTRCNVLPLSVDIESSYYTESSRSALKAIFKSWTVDSCREWLSSPDQIGIPLSLEEDTSKLFPTSNSAEEVRDKLVAACLKLGVEFRYNAQLKGLQQTDGGWECTFSGNSGRDKEIVKAQKVVLATGGKSFPTLGTDGVGYGLCKALGHTLHSPYPALTPLLGTHPGGHQLAGLSMYSIQLAVQAPSNPGAGKKKGGSKKKSKQQAQRTAMLLTHRGFSGPAVLDLSHNITMGLERGGDMDVENFDGQASDQTQQPQLRVNWLRDWTREDWEKCISESAASSGASLVATVLRKQGIPARLAEALCDATGMPANRKVSELRKAERLQLLNDLVSYQLPITGHEGYPKAEVTGGGVPLEELDCSTMESRIAPGLHLAGEVVDVHGRIGGYNFFWAWISGRLAGLGAAKNSNL